MRHAKQLWEPPQEHEVSEEPLERRPMDAQRYHTGQGSDRWASSADR